MGVLTGALIFSRKIHPSLWNNIEGGGIMILFSVLAIILAILVVLSIAALALGGVVGFILFGDLIVCVALIVWLMRKLYNRNH
jgi:hypothetical protein